MEQVGIIPTRLKSKIPNALSYPIGAKAISEALAGVPQFAELTIDYCYRNKVGLRPGSDKHSYRVIEAHYWPQPRVQYNNLFGWKICVDAVPRLLKHEIQTKIRAEALPSIKRWLGSSPHSGEAERSQRITFTFDELEDELLVEEYRSTL